MVIFELDKVDKVYAERIVEVCDLSLGVVEPKSVNGLSEIVQVGVMLSPLVIPALANVLTEIVKNKRTIRIKIGNREVEGLSEDNALMVLQQLLEYEDNK